MKPQADFEKSLDHDLYERLIACGGFPFGGLEGDNELRTQEYIRFQAGKVENPTFQYPSLSLEALQKSEHLLRQFQESLSSGSEGVVEKAYQRVVTERLEKNLLLQAVASQDMEFFYRQTSLVYGAPVPEIFAYTVDRIRDRAKKSGVAESLLKALSPPSISTDLTFVPNDFFEHVQEKVLREFPFSLEVISENQRFTAPEINTIFREVLSKLHFAQWTSDVMPEKINIAVHLGEKRIYVPANRVAFGKDLRALLLHEIGTHVARTYKGKQGPLRLMGYGLDRYLKGEEGVATLREQVVRGATDYFGEDRYLAIGLVWGLDGKPRNFRETYEIMKSYYRWIGLPQEQSYSDEEEYASSQAWRVCARIFRGTSGQDRGVCLTKDLFYREGNIAIWKLLEKNISAMDYFDVGKYDPTNLEHVTLLKHLKILPETYELPT